MGLHREPGDDPDRDHRLGRLSLPRDAGTDARAVPRGPLQPRIPHLLRTRRLHRRSPQLRDLPRGHRALHHRDDRDRPLLVSVGDGTPAHFGGDLRLPRRADHRDRLRLPPGDRHERGLSPDHRLPPERDRLAADRRRAPAAARGALDDRPARHQRGDAVQRGVLAHRRLHHLLHHEGVAGGHGYNAAALTPHEAKMASVLEGWRWRVLLLVALVVPICVKTVLEHPDFAGIAAGIQADLAAEPASRHVMLRVPTAPGHLLPAGLLGLMLTAMYGSYLAVDNAYLHSWASIGVQDVVLPIRSMFTDRPLSPRVQIGLIYLAVVGVAAFAFLFGLRFESSQYVAMWATITGSVFVAGAGSVIIGGLYWRRGSTAAAWSAMFVGIVLSLYAILAKEQLAQAVVRRAARHAARAAGAGDARDPSESLAERAGARLPHHPLRHRDLRDRLPARAARAVQPRAHALSRPVSRTPARERAGVSRRVRVVAPALARAARLHARVQSHRHGDHLDHRRLAASLDGDLRGRNGVGALRPSDGGDLDRVLARVHLAHLRRRLRHRRVVLDRRLPRPPPHVRASPPLSRRRGR